MIEEINKQIEVNKDILSTLPKNNHKNINKYKNKLNSLIEEYTNYQESIKEEILKRKKKFLKIEENQNIKIIKSKLDNITNSFYLFSESNSSYEKIGLDKIIYNISRYYNSNLNEVNKNIYQAIIVFKKVGITLTAKEFNYSHYLNQYMKTYYTEINNLDSDIIKTTFEKIYWQCSDLLMHLELNFKFLYFKYKNNFDDYCERLKKEVLKNKTTMETWNEYLTLKKEYDVLINKDIYGLLSKFKEKVLTPNDFTSEKIENNYQELVSELTDKNSINANISKFYYSLQEYQNYLDVKYILENIQKLYAEKDKYKNVSKKDFKEINKYQNKLSKLNKKINWYLRKNKDVDKLNVSLNGNINQLKKLYDNLDISLFKERIFKQIQDSSTYYDILELVYSNYLYLVKCIKENFPDIEKEEIEIKINKLKEILLSPYNNFINIITINDNKDIKMIVSDCYKLANFNINPSIFDNEDEINNLKDILYKILVNNWIEESNLTIEDIKFYCLVEDMEF